MSRFLALLLFPASLVLAQGGTAIPLLEMPPSGDGYHALRAGGPFPSGTALYYNPALLAELGRATESRTRLAYNAQEFRSGLSQDFTTLSGSLPDGGQGFDVGIGFFHSRLDYGENLVPADSSLQGFRAVEAVYGLGAALRLGGPISVGGAVKVYDSHFSPGVRATGFAFDAGVAARRAFYPAAEAGLPSLEVIPATGFALQNMGSDVWYVDPDQADPLPFLFRASVGTEIRFADAVGLAVAEDWQMALDERSRGEYRRYRNGVGFSAAVMGVRYGRAWNFETDVDREVHEAVGFEFNLLQAQRLRRRFREKDFRSSSEAMGSKPVLPEYSLFGAAYRLNPGFTIGRYRTIPDDFLRPTWYFGVSL